MVLGPGLDRGLRVAEVGDLHQPHVAVAGALGVVAVVRRHQEQLRAVAAGADDLLLDSADRPDGAVGAIGGIQQKIVGARGDGAQLFLVPSDNCDDSQGARNGDMRLVKVTNFTDAKSSLEAWAKDHDAKLPSCG